MENFSRELRTQTTPGRSLYFPFCSRFHKAGKGREGKGREGKGREGKGREGKGREGKGREGKGREGKGRGSCFNFSFLQNVSLLITMGD